MKNSALVKGLHVRSTQSIASGGGRLVQLPYLLVRPEHEHLCVGGEVVYIVPYYSQGSTPRTDGDLDHIDHIDQIDHIDHLQ